LKGRSKEYKAFRSFEEDVDGRVQNLSGSIKELEQKKRDVNVTALDESVKAASYKLGFIKVGNWYLGNFNSFVRNLYIVFPAESCFCGADFCLCTVDTGICLYGKSRKGQSSKT